MLGWFRNRRQAKPVLSAELTAALDNYLSLAQSSTRKRLNQARLVAVDFETSGLNAKQDTIISMGFAPIADFSIQLRHCKHLLVNSQPELCSENVAVHGIMQDELRRGVSQEAALIEFLNQVSGKIVVAHYHIVERHFIQALSRHLTGHPIPLIFLDTFQIARQRMHRRQQAITPSSLRLFNLRKDYGLPAYNAHNALEDAIATGELFLAEAAAASDSPQQLRLAQLEAVKYRR